MKIPHLLLAGLAFCLWLVPQTPSGRAQTQAEMNEEAGQDLKKADRALNAAYRKVLNEHSDDEGFSENLRAAQRAWLEFVDLHLKTVFPVEEGEDPRTVYGSMYAMEYAGAKTELVEERTAQLEALLAE